MTHQPVSHSSFSVPSLIKSMRLRTLPLSLAGVVCGGFLATAKHGSNPLLLLLVALTACLLQVLSNLSNELGDYRSGVDGEKRNGPEYSLLSGGLTEGQLSHAVKATAVVCLVVGLLMALVSCRFSVLNVRFFALLLLGAAAVWAATHYTLGKNPYGYRGLGDIFVFIFFGLVSVMGSYFVMTGIVDWQLWLILPAAGMGLLSVGVLNVNNMRDMESDKDLRTTTPIRIGLHRAKLYHTALISIGFLSFVIPVIDTFGFSLLSLLLMVPFLVCAIMLTFHVVGVWRRKPQELDPMLPFLVFSTFFLALFYSLVYIVIG